jgi:glycosyltransferase involved in cell wall biosynthesis
MKKLFVIIENYAFGGANKYAEDIISSLDDSFTDIEIIGNKASLKYIYPSRLPLKVKFKETTIFNTSEIIKKYPKALRVLLRVCVSPFSFIINFISILRLNSYIKKSGEHKVIAFSGGYPASLYLIWSLICINKKAHSYLSIVSTPKRRENWLLSPIWKLTDHLVQNCTNAIIVNSSAIKKELITSCFFNETSVNVLRNGIPDILKYEKKESKEIVIGFVSRLEPTKGLNELITAFKKIQENGIKAKLVIAGAGSLDLEMKRISESIANITYMGHYSGEIHALLHRFDIFVLPSYHEGLPYSLIEAARSGCAIISTNVGGIPEIITDQVNGYLIPPQDSEALFKALNELITDDQRRNHLSQRARQNFLDQFTIGKMQENAKIIFRL